MEFLFDAIGEAGRRMDCTRCYAGVGFAIVTLAFLCKLAFGVSQMADVVTNDASAQRQAALAPAAEIDLARQQRTLEQRAAARAARLDGTARGTTRRRQSKGKMRGAMLQSQSQRSLDHLRQDAHAAFEQLNRQADRLMRKADQMPGSYITVKRQ